MSELNPTEEAMFGALRETAGPELNEEISERIAQEASGGDRLPARVRRQYVKKARATIARQLMQAAINHQNGGQASDPVE